MKPLEGHLLRPNSFGVPVYTTAATDPIDVRAIERWGKIVYYADRRQSLVVQLRDGALATILRSTIPAKTPLRKALDSFADLMPEAGKPSANEGVRIRWLGPIDDRLADAQVFVPLGDREGEVVKIKLPEGEITIEVRGKRHPYWPFPRERTWRHAAAAPDLAWEDGERAMREAAEVRYAQALRSVIDALGG